jgi:hypothetical protein
MLHMQKTSGYLFEGLDDGIGVLERLGLATEVTSDGLLQPLAMFQERDESGQSYLALGDRLEDGLLDVVGVVA